MEKRSRRVLSGTTLVSSQNHCVTKRVRVGIMVTHNPLYGSGQAGLPHPALTSGDNAHAAQGIRMTSAGGRQPAVDQAPHSGPKHVGVLAAPRQSAMPE